jgi:hypothetical protein
MGTAQNKNSLPVPVDFCFKVLTADGKRLNLP